MDLKVEKNPKKGSSLLKSCSSCNTTRTPLWRGGPAGPKSLCNACGIKYNKKRREMLGLVSSKEKGKKKKRSNSGSSKSGGNDQVMSSQSAKKMRVMALGHDMLLLHRSDKLMSKLREEEQAAILLMALSCGSVIASV